MSRFFSVFVVVFVLLCPAGFAEEFKGKCVGVTDGDTISVMREGKAEKVRLYGIDCPEVGQPFATKAKQATSDYVFGKEVTVKSAGKDRYGRTIGVVLLPNGSGLNVALVNGGLAWHYKAYSKEKALADYEVKAREAKRGVWSQDSPVAPWDFRKDRKRDHDDLSVGSGLVAEAEATTASVRVEEEEKGAVPGAHVEESVVRAAPVRAAAGVQKRGYAGRQAVPMAGGDRTVYLSQEGNKYHRFGCGTLKKTPIAVPLSQAIRAGRGACGVCKP